MGPLRARFALGSAKSVDVGVPRLLKVLYLERRLHEATEGLL